MRAVQSVAVALIATLLVALAPDVAHAQRIKGLARGQGSRELPLSGIGLMIGFDSTGDSQRNHLLKAYRLHVLSNMGTGIRSSVTDVKPQNAALVMVNATVPSSMQMDTEFEANVSSVGDGFFGRGVGEELLKNVLVGEVARLLAQRCASGTKELTESSLIQNHGAAYDEGAQTKVDKSVVKGIGRWI